MDFNELRENIIEEIRRPLKVGDWVSGKNFDMGAVLHTDGNLVTVRIVDSPNHEPGDVFGFNIVDLTILDNTDVEKEQILKKTKKFQSKTRESKQDIYEDMSYSAGRASFHLDRIVAMAKDNATETADLARYLKDVLDYLSKIDWKKVKKT